MNKGQTGDISREYLSVALVQTKVPKEAWGPSRFPGRSAIIEWRVWQELRIALRGIEDGSIESPPKMILIPELSVPESRIPEMKKIAGSLKAVIMCGVDYKRDFKTKPKQVENRACVIVPHDWPDCDHIGGTKEVYIGKSYPSLGEEALLKAKGWAFKGDATVYLFESRIYGRIGVCICYDFLDIERHLMYRGGHIQHLVVLSYNRDFESFYHNAEALARTLFCNVVVCNTGTYGGSLAVAPFYEPFKRTIYRHQGSQLSTIQIVQLPVRDLIKAQTGQFDRDRLAASARSARHGVPGEQRLWKSLPPGYPIRDSKSVILEQSVLALDT